MTAYEMRISDWSSDVCSSDLGFGMVVHGVTTQSLIQHACEPAMLGRVLSIYGLSFRAGPALGAILMGAASEFVGLRIPVAVGAVLCIGAWWWAERRRRPMQRVLEESEAGSSGWRGYRRRNSRGGRGRKSTRLN